MNNEYQISFCKYCSNSKFDQSEGLVCSIDKQIMNFENQCKYFKKDLSLINKYKLKSERFSGNFLNITEQIIDVIYHRKININETFVVKTSKIKNILSFAGILLGFILLGISPFFKNGSLLDSLVLFTILIALFSFEIALIISEYKLSVKKGNIIELNNKGLKINGEFRAWKNFVGFTAYKDKSPIGVTAIPTYTYSLEFEFIGKLNDPVIIINNLNISKRKLIKTIKEYNKNFA